MIPIMSAAHRLRLLVRITQHHGDDDDDDSHSLRQAKLPYLCEIEDGYIPGQQDSSGSEAHTGGFTRLLQRRHTGKFSTTPVNDDGRQA
jgi:hypothetical protein